MLDELPPEGRIYLMKESGIRAIVTGVSPEFAMTKMDEESHPECDIYVEDSRAVITHPPPPCGLRESHNCGMISQFPSLDHSIEP